MALSMAETARELFELVARTHVSAAPGAMECVACQEPAVFAVSWRSPHGAWITQPYCAPHWERRWARYSAGIVPAAEKWGLSGN